MEVFLMTNYFLKCFHANFVGRPAQRNKENDYPQGNSQAVYNVPTISRD